jgi:hypothetical protein
MSVTSIYVEGGGGDILGLIYLIGFDLGKNHRKK